MSPALLALGRTTGTSRYIITAIGPQLAHHRKHMSSRGGGSTPAGCIADFCLLPLGTQNASVSPLIAQVQTILSRQQGIRYELGFNGTSVEGSWEDVTRAIGVVHQELHDEHGVVRIHTDIRIGTRTDKPQTAKDKRAKVEQLLAEGK